MPGKIKTFRDLLVWQRGKTLCLATFRITQDMPQREMFGLSQQMRRAAVSIPSNIAEGYAHRTRPEYLRSLKIAMGSLAELCTQIEIAAELELIRPSPELNNLLAEEDRLLSSLIAKLSQ